MKLLDLSASMARCVPFRLSEAVRVPEASGCYALANINNDVLYIGESINLHQRIKQHLDSQRMTGRTQLGPATWFYFGFWPIADIRPLETRFLVAFKAVEGGLPVLNRMGP